MEISRVALRSGRQNGLKTIRRNQRKAPFCGAILTTVGLSSFVLLFCLLNATANPQQQQQQQQQQQKLQQQADRSSSAKSSDFQQQAQRAALEAELNNIVQQHDASGANNNKHLVAAIISRLMVDNLTGSSMNGGVEANDLINIGAGSEGTEPGGLDGGSLEMDQSGSSGQLAGPSAIESMHLRNLLGLLQNFEGPNGRGSQMYEQYPILPSNQAATMKRAVIKNLQQQQQALQQRLNGYGRNSFDFGLGKRPDGGNVLRYGDSFGVNGGVQAVGQFGKRPSAHRYDFGLGKRVASPTYPRYDFGLGKRAPSRVRYDFGLGK